MTNSNTKPIPWADTKVNSWNTLLAKLHSLEMIPLQSGQGGHRRSPYLFRGMSDASWPLMTSLERLGSVPAKVEEPALRAFSRYAPIGTVSLKSEWDRLAVAQHNGLPSRVLDWTASPLVAAHFATEEKEYRTGPKAADGVIWCVNADTWVERLLPKKMRDYLREKQAYVYSVPMLDKLYPELKDFDRSFRRDLMVFFEPPSIDARIQNQFGLLSAMNGPARSHDDFLRRHAQELPGFVRRIIIRKRAKPGIRDMLDQNNISERMLFPGLPGLCDWLARYYGPA
jgi:hypothetical protein